MLKKDNTTKILEIFFDDPIPENGFQLREISRNVKIAPKSVKIHLKNLEKERLIIVKKHRVLKYPIYYANRDHEYFKFLKIISILKRIKESELVDHLNEKCAPEVIFLFGSCSRGEDTKSSDIDIYLKADQVSLDLTKYEKKLNRKINLFFESDFNLLSKELKENIVNGIKLKGFLRWKD